MSDRRGRAALLEERKKGRPGTEAKLMRSERSDNTSRSLTDGFADSKRVRALFRALKMYYTPCFVQHNSWQVLLELFTLRLRKSYP